MNKVSVITVNYNQAQVTEELLHSISLCNHYPQLEIIVVDNGSETNMIPIWEKKFADCRFIRSETNLGFAGGNNLGIAQATGDYLFLVNNDTEFTPSLVETLTRVLDTHPEVAVVSPKIRFFHQPGLIQYAGFTSMNFYTARNKRIGEFEEDLGQYDAKSGYTAFADGAAMMVRREAIEAAGLMAEHFFLYYEEMDWCERMRKAGYKIWVEPQALIYHKESVSVGKTSTLKEFFMNRNRILFIRRNGTRLQQLIFYGYFMLFVVPRNLLSYLRAGRMELANPLFRAVWWNLRHHQDSTYHGFKH